MHQSLRSHYLLNKVSSNILNRPPNNKWDISVLPEGCISTILSFTSPQDVCVLSLVSMIFKSAGYSDVLWEKFLPSDYKDVIINNFSSKKELYFHLCDNPLLLFEGNMSLNLERKSGKKCFMVGAKQLDITGGDNPQYWKWISHSCSRFANVAELLNVCWLSIKGKINTRMLSPKTIYAVHMVIKFSEDTYGLDHAATDVNVEFVGGVGHASGGRSVYLHSECNMRPNVHYVRHQHQFGLLRHRYGHIIRPPTFLISTHFPSERRDGWMEIELGEFYNDQGEDGEVEMSLSQSKSVHWKAGLIVQGIELRPKKNNA
ncbi:hypothetical protein AQUCO_03800193v1 [Aquilegia coerulea]|uniref:F-box domain-containing protein n=1 Tax=Aquilegia coerulea TaxID=218851 RepID=A0A2G5CT73_AQUCA|nr:hypothetical protein AQUCO_03800193v1 [Aquilegia coerulea]